jgi:hypothetical protein
MDQAFDGKHLSQPIKVSGLLNGRSVATIQPAYLLTEVDFERLKGSPPITASLASLVFSGVVGYAIGLGPKIAPILESKPTELTSAELRTIVFGTVVSAILYVIGYAWPNSKKKTMKKIANHFDGAPASAHIVGESE